MYSKASFVFWITLILYIFTLVTVSYVGVYLTYITIPVIIISGLIMLITKPSPENDILRKDTEMNQEIEHDSNDSIFVQSIGITNQVLNQVNITLADVSDGLSELTNSIREVSEIRCLTRERSQHLRMRKIELEADIFCLSKGYDRDMNILTDDVILERQKFIAAEISDIDDKIEMIKLACEIEIKSKKIN